MGTKRTERDIKIAIEFFQKAIALEPNYALAYSGLADAYHMLGSSYVVSSVQPRDAFPEARKAALKALEIDASLAEVSSVQPRDAFPEARMKVTLRWRPF